MLPFSYRGNRLTCEDVPLNTLAAAHGTPLYVYSSDAIVRRCRLFTRILAGSNHLPTYAVKANSNPAVLKLIAEQGFGADVASQGELFLAVRAGFPPERITFSGVGKREDEIAYAIEKGVRLFEIESEQELERVNAVAGTRNVRVPALLRLNLDINAGGHDYIATSRKHDKFGLEPHRVLRLMKCAAHYPYVELRGLSSHIGSQITETKPFVETATRLRRLVNEFRHEGITIHDLDVGGGFGVPYEGFLEHPALPERRESVASVEKILGEVLPILEETGCRILVQPGRAIVAEAGALIVRVLYRKETDAKTFLIVDGGMNDLIRPSLYRAYHQIVPLELTGGDLETVDIVGPCCEAGDFFALDRSIPRMERGGYLAILCAGAYGFVLSSNYNARLRPAEVLVSCSQPEVIRKRETLDDLL